MDRNQYSGTRKLDNRLRYKSYPNVEPKNE